MGEVQAVRLVQRDIDIIKLTNRFGFMTAPQIQRWLGVGQAVTYRRLAKLSRAGLIESIFVFSHYPAMRRPTREACRLAGESLPPAKIRLSTFLHDVAVVDVYLALMQQHPGAEWITEREIRQQAASRGDRDAHTPDAIMILPGGVRIAIEVELQAKSAKRLDKILKWYDRSDFHTVWYMCASRRLADAVAARAKHYSFIRVDVLADVLGRGTRLEHYQKQ